MIKIINQITKGNQKDKYFNEGNIFKRVHRGLRDLYDINAKMYEILQTYNKITTVEKTKNFGDTIEII